MTNSSEDLACLALVAHLSKAIIQRLGLLTQLKISRHLLNFSIVKFYIFVHGDNTLEKEKYFFLSFIGNFF